jgi:ribosomal protein S18 acetylase RimI-like enzyme
MPIHFLPLRQPSEVDNYRDCLGLLVYETACQHFDWLFGRREDALSNLESSVGRINSQFSGLRATLALAGDQVAGAFMAMPGRDLPARQRADLLAFLSSRKGPERSEMLQRFSLIAHLDAPVDPSDYYLRALAVDTRYRRHGLGRQLLQQCLDEGRASGCRQCRLEVRVDNEPAMSLYSGAGFRCVREAPATYLGRDIKVASMVLVL